MTVNERPLFGAIDIQHMTAPLTPTFSTRGGTATSGVSVVSLGGVGDVPPVATCARINWTTIPTSSPASFGYAGTPGLRVTPGEVVTLSAYVIATFLATTGWRFDVQMTRADGSAIPPSGGTHTIPPINTWTRVSRVFTVPEECTHIRIAIVYSGQNVPEAVGKYCAVAAAQITSGDELQPYVPTGDPENCRRVNLLTARSSNLGITRGGVRSGLGIQTDVGLCTFTLENHLDPLRGGRIMPGETVRVMAGTAGRAINHPTRRLYSYGFENYREVKHPAIGHWEPGPDVIVDYETIPAETLYTHGFEDYSAINHTSEVVYSYGFEDSFGGWDDTYASRYDDGGAREGQFYVEAYGDLSRTFTGLTPGRSYTFEVFAWAYAADTYINYNVDDTTYQAHTIGPAETWTATSITFKPESDVAVITLGANWGTVRFDSLKLTANDWAEVLTDGLGGWDNWENQYEVTGAVSHSGSYSYATTETSRLFSVTPGLSYTLSAWAYASVDSTARITTDTSSSVALTGGEWNQVSHTFTATSSSIEIYLEGTPWDADRHWDDITLVRDAYDVPIYGPGPDVWVVDTPAWTEVTNNGLAGWTGTVQKTTSAYSGQYVLTGSNNARTFTGLKVGHPYRLEWYARVSNVWVLKTFDFTATSSSRVLTLTGGEWKDGVSLSRRSWVEIIPADVSPIFTGRVVDVAATYPLRKATGEMRSRVTVTVADAVQIHVTTPRYGVQLPSPYYETFEARISRLAGSAKAPLIVPTVGAPREIYSL